MMTQVVRWRGLDPKTFEHCEIDETGDETRVRAVLIAPDYGLTYSILLDGSKRIRRARLERTDGATLLLEVDPSGAWTLNETDERPDLDGCIDVDIWPTPLTNSLPLWRKALHKGQPTRFSMAWIDADAMSVRRDEQIYTRLDETHIRFQSADGTFELVLDVDADDLVMSYPGLFVRES